MAGAAGLSLGVCRPGLLPRSMNWLKRIIAPLSGLTDEQAMWRVQMHDDQEAFAELVRRWHPPIWSLCLRMTGDSHRGEDLAQEAFVRVFAGRARFQQGRRFSTWLWRIALNVCHDEHRRAQRHPETPLADSSEEEWEGPALAALEPAPDEQAASRDRAELVRLALQALPETHRAVVSLREYEGLKLREIAEVLDIPEGTVKSRMADALARLAVRLGPLLNENETKPTRPPRSRQESLVL